MLLTNFTITARYNVLTPIALLAVLCFGTSAFAAEQVIAAGVIDSDGLDLADGDSLTNSGTISNNGGSAVVYDVGGAGGIAFILNTETGTISATGGSAIYINGDLTEFENSGLVASDTNAALQVDGDLGSFLNTGTMTGTGNSAVNAQGHVGSFTNSGTGIINGVGFQAVNFQHGVDTFRNEGTIANTDAGSDDGSGVVFDTDATTGGAVGSFENYGTISADMASSDGNGVGFYGSTAFQTGSFFNAGSIAGPNGGVSSDGGFGSFTNTSTGVISGVADSGLFSAGPIGSFSNAGSISSVDRQGVSIDGVVGSFSNSGSITSANSRAIGFSDAVGDFNNSGTVTGLNDDGIGYDGAVGRFENSGDITSLGNGVTFRGGVTTANNSGNIISTATIGGFGVRIDEPGGTFINTGTIQGSIAAVGYSLNTPGANTFINAGTLKGIGASGIALNFAAGVADGDDTLKLLTGSRIEGDIAFGGGTDVLDFSGFTGNALLRAYDLEDIVAGDNLYYYDQPNDEIAIIDKTGITAPGAVAARDISMQLQNMLASQLSNLGSSATQVDAVLNYGPAPVQSEAALAIGDNADLAPNRAVWGSVIGGGSRDDAPVALSNVFGGIVAGSHAQVSGNTTIGVLGGYVAGNLDIGDGGQTVRSDTGVVGVYGRSEFGNIDLDYSLIGGFNGHHSERDMTTPSGETTATADYGSWFISPSAGIAVPVLTNASGELRVAGRLSYVGGQVEGYSETGPGVNLTVGDQDIGVLDARFGLDGTIWGDPSAAGAVKFTVNAGLFVQSNLGGSSTPVSFLGQTQNVASAGTTTYGLYGGAGISAEVAANVSVNGSLDGQVGNDGVMAGTAKAGLVGSF